MPKSKGYLRHVALSVADPWETAEFYKEIAGLEEVAEIDGEFSREHLFWRRAGAGAASWISTRKAWVQSPTGPPP